jgi:hypothetical protein
MHQYFWRLAVLLFGLAILTAFIPQVPLIIMMALAVGGLVAVYVAYQLYSDPDSLEEDEQRK